VILIRDVHVVTSPHIVPNINSKMTNDSTSATNEAAVSYTNDRICQTLLTWDHSSRQRNMSSDHGVCTNVYVSLIENCGLRKTDNAVFSEGTESFPSYGVWAYGSMQREPVPNRMRYSLLEPQGFKNHELQSNR
jgi:hypothetical protein